MAETDLRASPTDNPTGQHELSDVNIRGVVLFGIGLTITSALIYIAVWLLYEYLARRQQPFVQPAGQSVVSRPTPSKPQLQVEPQSELAQLRASEEQSLSNYGWVDREKGIVRIPIERAMEIIARDGVPAAKQSSSGGAKPAQRKKEQ